MVHQLPVRAAVERAPELPALGLAPVPGHPVAGLDQRVHPVGIGGRKANIGLPHREHRQLAALEAGPGVAAVVAQVDAAALASALPAPGVHLHGPHAGEEPARVGRVHLDARGAGVLVHEENVLPALAPVRGAKDSARALRPVRVAQRAHVHDVRVVRMNHDARHARGPALAEPHVAPRPARVGGLVDAGAERDVRADVRLTRPGPHHRRIRRRDGQRPDRVVGLGVEDGLPVQAAVHGLPDAARGGPRVVGQRVSGNPGHRRETVADGPDVTVPKLLVGFRRDVLRRARAREPEDGRQKAEGTPHDSREDRVHRHFLVWAGRMCHGTIEPPASPRRKRALRDAGTHLEPCLPHLRMHTKLVDW